MAIATPPSVPFTTPVGVFVRYHVVRAGSRKRAIADAKIMARVAGFTVEDVVQAVEQPHDDGWLVELEVRV